MEDEENVIFPPERAEPKESSSSYVSSMRRVKPAALWRLSRKEHLALPGEEQSMYWWEQEEEKCVQPGIPDLGSQGKRQGAQRGKVLLLATRRRPDPSGVVLSRSPPREAAAALSRVKATVRSFFPPGCWAALRGAEARAWTTFADPQSTSSTQERSWPRCLPQRSLDQMSRRDFVEKFEGQGQPLLITGTALPSEEQAWGSPGIGCQFHVLAYEKANVGDVVANWWVIPNLEGVKTIAGLPFLDTTAGVENERNGTMNVRPAFHPETLASRFGSREVELKEAEQGIEALLPLGDYLAYAARDSDGDRNPLYVFDSAFEASLPEIEEAWRNVAPMHIFCEDHLARLGPEKRLHWRWLLVGAARSGTPLHVNPLATSAWNMVLHGRKRWILFPPTLERPLPPGVEEEEADEEDEDLKELNIDLGRHPEDCFGFFCNGRLDQLKEGAHQGPLTLKATELHEGDTPARSSPTLWYDFEQKEGDVLFIPRGWWHAAINLETTVALSQNFFGSADVD